MTALSPDEFARDGAALRALGAVGVIGTGAAGGALARALAARGARVVAVTSGHVETAARVAATIPDCQAVPDGTAVVSAADTVLLAVPDNALATLDAALPWRARQAVIHLSGTHGIGALPQAAAHGAATAALHPLMLFPRPPLEASAALARLAGCTWALAASDAALAERLERVVAALDGRVVRLTEGGRVPYHVAAVLASNYVVTLLGAAVGIWEELGIARGAALDALLPLLRATVDNLATLGPVQALTGPVARGDTSTVAAHLAWLAAAASAASVPTPSDTPSGLSAPAGADPSAPSARTDGHPSASHSRAPLASGPSLRARGKAGRGGPDLLPAYIALARLAIPLALERGTLSESAAQTLRELLDDAGK